MMATLYRWLATALVRGDDAVLVREDLQELLDGDRARGLSSVRVASRAVRRLVASSWHLRFRGRSRRGGERRSFHFISAETILRDMKVGWLALRHRPGAALISTCGLALGIGVVVSVFAVVDATMLRPYAMVDPSSVVAVGWSRLRGFPLWPAADFFAMQRGARLSRLEGSAGEPVSIELADGTDVGERFCAFVSGGFLPMLAGRPMLGRLLTPGDDRAGAMPVAVASEAFWRAQLRGDAAAIGASVIVNGTTATLVGVLPRGFTAPLEVPAAVWLPLSMHAAIVGGPSFAADGRGRMDVLARVAPSAPFAAVESELAGLLPDTADRRTSRAMVPREVQLSSVARPVDGPRAAESWFGIAAALGIAGLVLAVACANASNLLLAAAITRRREMGVRLALGATRRRLIAQVLNESLILALASGGFGILCALWMAPALAVAIHVPAELDVKIDGRTLVFCVGVALLSVVGASLSAARYGSGGHVLTAIADSAATRRAGRRQFFVGFQASISVFMLVAAALFVRAAIVAGRTDAGFDIDSLAAVSFENHAKTFDSAAYLSKAVAAIRDIPGVQQISVVADPPFGTSVGADPLLNDAVSARVTVERTDERFLATTGMRLVRGRFFSPDEVRGNAPVALVSESLAQRFFGGVDPVGRSLSAVPARDTSREPATVIGVIADAVVTPPHGEPVGTIYRPLSVRPMDLPSLLVRSPTPALTARAIEVRLRQLDPATRVRTSQVREGFEAFQTFQRTAVAVALPTAALAALLAAIGMFGVTSFALGQRTREISVRTALGASTREIVGQLLTDSLRPIAIGLVIGLGLALVAGRVLAHEIGPIGPFDPIAIGSALALMSSASLAAVISPARRAAKCDPAALFRQADGV